MTREELAARVRRQVAESCARQSLPPTVTDPEFLAELAAAVATGMLARAEHDDAGLDADRRRLRKQPRRRRETGGGR